MVLTDNARYLKTIESTQFLLSFYFVGKEFELTKEFVWKLDLSQPSQEFAASLLSIYYSHIALVKSITPEKKILIENVYGPNILDAINNFGERINIILPELQKVSEGLATEEDYEELAWQNTLANKKETLVQMAQKASQEYLQNQTLSMDCE